MFNSLSWGILKYPVPIIMIIALITSCFFWSAFLSESPLRVDFSLEQMFPEKDPEKDDYDKFINQFGREDDKILLAYQCDNPTSRENIIKLRELTELLEFDVDGVESVISLSNIEYGEYFSDILSDDDWSSRGDKLLSHPIYANLIISKNKKTAGIILDIENGIITQDDRLDILNQINEIISSVDWEWHIAGNPALRTRYIEFMNHERSIFVPISFLVAGLVLIIIFRQIKSIVITLISISATLIWVAGIMAYLNITINVASYLTFNLLMIIGASNAIHLLMKYHECLSLGLRQEEALQRVIDKIGTALFLTSFTTAVGFCSLSLTNIRITQEFGLLVGFGVILMFILTVVIMPILLSFVSPPKKIHVDRLIKGDKFQSAEKLNNWNLKYPKLILFCSVLLFFMASVGLFKMDFNASIMEDLRPGNPIYDDIQFVENNLGGTLSLEIVINSHDSLSALKPDFIQKIDQFKQSILQIDEISKVVTPGDYISIINEQVSGSREIPQSLDEVHSLVELGIDQMGTMLNEDYSKSRISCKVSDLDYKRSIEIKNKIRDLSKSIIGNDISTIITGSTLLALSTNRHLVKNLTMSFIIAFIIIFISIVILFRSLRLSLLAVLPNIIPLRIAGGVMGDLGIKLRPSTAMTFSIALGIAVDNTIHFLARFRQEYIDCGEHIKAVTNTLLTTGKAIISTGIILSLGFIVLYFSEFVPNHEFGILATIIIITAVSGSLILLPVMIMLVKPNLRLSSNELLNSSKEV